MIASPGRLFAHRLAATLGMTVGQLAGSMSAAEFADWRTFDAVHGLPDAREDWRSAMRAYIAASAAGAKDLQFSDLMPPAPEEAAGKRESESSGGASGGASGGHNPAAIENLAALLRMMKATQHGDDNRTTQCRAEPGEPAADQRPEGGADCSA